MSKGTNLNSKLQEVNCLKGGRTQVAEALSFSVSPLIGRVDDAGSLNQSRGEPKQN